MRRCVSAERAHANGPCAPVHALALGEEQATPVRCSPVHAKKHLALGCFSWWLDCAEDCSAVASLWSWIRVADTSPLA
jgi:hypothetical protein